MWLMHDETSFQGLALHFLSPPACFCSFSLETIALYFRNLGQYLICNLHRSAEVRENILKFLRMLVLTLIT